MSIKLSSRFAIIIRMYDKIYYVKEQPSKPSKKIKQLKYFFLLSVFLFTVNVFANIFIYPTVAKGSVFVSPLARDIIQKTVSFINSQENSGQIEKIVKEVLENNTDNYGIVIKNLKTGERYYLNNDKIFDTASLYKLWVMAVVFKQIDEGKLKEADVLSDEVKSLNMKFNISTESADLTEGTVTLQVGNALQKMIIISDNYSALLLTQRIGVENLAHFLSENNFNDSKVGTAIQNPKTSARDIASFLDKLYHDKLNNNSSSKKMLDLLKKQQLNGKIPKYIDNSIDIAHKTGELGAVSHDAGIIYGAKSNFIIVVLSTSSNQAVANEKISLISKKVYDYFSK